MHRARISNSRPTSPEGIGCELCIIRRANFSRVRAGGGYSVSPVIIPAYSAALTNIILYMCIHNGLGAVCALCRLPGVGADQ